MSALAAVAADRRDRYRCGRGAAGGNGVWNRSCGENRQRVIRRERLYAQGQEDSVRERAAGSG
jgi:hypothetical protein